MSVIQNDWYADSQLAKKQKQQPVTSYEVSFYEVGEKSTYSFQHQELKKGGLRFLFFGGLKKNKSLNYLKV